MTDGTEGSLLIEPGAMVDRYLVVKRLAYGGMAEIFLARDTAVAGVSRQVVLKCIHPEILEDPAVVELFVDEIRIVARLSHENIAHVYDFGESLGTYYMAMEHVEGMSLRQLALKLAPATIPVEHVVKIGSDVAVALHYAHTLQGDDGKPLGIIHRDVSPQNILVSVEGQVKLLDFGVAKAADQLHHTQVGTLRGKCAYMAPEQCLELPMDHRVDIFALGIVLHEMLSGRRLFRRETAVETIRAICTPSIPRPSSFRSEVSPRLDDIVLRALARRPEDRYQSADALSIDLSQVLLDDGLTSNQVYLGRFVRDVLGVDVAPAGAPPKEVEEATGPSPLGEDHPRDDEHTDVDALRGVGSTTEPSVGTPSSTVVVDAPTTAPDAAVVPSPPTMSSGSLPRLDAFDDFSIGSSGDVDADVQTLISDPPQEILLAALFEQNLSIDPAEQTLVSLSAPSVVEAAEHDAREEANSEGTGTDPSEALVSLPTETHAPAAARAEPIPEVEDRELLELPDEEAPTRAEPARPAIEPTLHAAYLTETTRPQMSRPFEGPVVDPAPAADPAPSWPERSDDQFWGLEALPSRRLGMSRWVIVLAAAAVIVIGAALGILAWSLWT